MLRFDQQRRKQTMKIKELADLMGVSTATIRFYEEKRLLLIQVSIKMAIVIIQKKT
jgi:DNA-binding transcriptional regulator YiaG